jgi:hypothetical protein
VPRGRYFEHFVYPSDVVLGREPAEPTQHLPRSLKKMDVMTERLNRGETLFHPQDATGLDRLPGLHVSELRAYEKGGSKAGLKGDHAADAILGDDF